MGEAYTSPIWLCTECRTPHPQPSPPAICSACKKAVSFTQQPLHWKENELPAEDHIEDTREPEQVVDAVNSPMVPGSPNPALESHTIKPLQYRLEEAEGYFRPESASYRYKWFQPSRSDCQRKRFPSFKKWMEALAPAFSSP